MKGNHKGAKMITATSMEAKRIRAATSALNQKQQPDGRYNDNSGHKGAERIRAATRALNK